MSVPDGYTSTFEQGSAKGRLLVLPSVLLDDIRTFVRRFVVLSDAQADTVTLWIAHTHAIDGFECTPYLAITSPEKRSGKTRLLEVIELLVHTAIQTANISDAALFRVIHEQGPTLLIDEVDAIFGKKSPREELRGMLNAGYRRGATTYRMGGAKMTTIEPFSVFCPKAFAGIGDCLPDTIADRAVSIRLKRRTRNVKIERFRLRDVRPEGHALRDRLVDWLEPNADQLGDSRPTLPDELDDRAQDVWEPLLAIADLAGGDWPERARRAALDLSTGEEREDDSVTARLIHDIASVFGAKGVDSFKTSDLLEELHQIEESPWGDWYGKPLTVYALSRLLKPYRIKTMSVYADGKTVRGYKLDQFADAFGQVGVRSVRSVRPESRSQAAPNASNASNASTAENVRNPLPGDNGYLHHLYAAFEGGHVTESEWKQLSGVHKTLVESAA